MICQHITHYLATCWLESKTQQMVWNFFHFPYIVLISTECNARLHLICTTRNRNNEFKL